MLPEMIDAVNSFTESRVQLQLFGEVGPRNLKFERSWETILQMGCIAMPVVDLFQNQVS